MTRVAIALGSNLGDRLGNLKKALRMMKIRGINITSRSDIFETHPMGPVHQNRFLNACVTGNSTMLPRELLATLKDIETSIGRLPRGKWGPREIDLDILLYADLIVKEEDLVIPHPEFPKRPFVLFPLVQIAPDWIHPLLKMSVRDLLEKLKAADQTMVRIARL